MTAKLRRGHEPSGAAAAPAGTGEAPFQRIGKIPIEALAM
jgi:hypothetical protein